MLNIKLGFTNCPPQITQVTQFCHLNHLLKKVVRDHDDASLGEVVLHENTMTELWGYEAYEMSLEQKYLINKLVHIKLANFENWRDISFYCYAIKK